MLTFHNDLGIKARYLDRITASLAAGRLSLFADWSADYWLPTAMTLDDEDADLSAYPKWLGLPEWMGILEDNLWLMMPQDRGSTWFIDFLAAIPVGVSEERLDRCIRVPFMLTLLRDALHDFDRRAFPQVEERIHMAIRFWERDDLFSNRWHADAVQMAKAARAAIPDLCESPQFTARRLAVTALPDPDEEPCEQLGNAMHSLNPSRADTYAEDIVHRLKSLRTPRRSDPMLNAIRAAS